MNELTDAEKIVELNKIIDYNHDTIEKCITLMEQMEKDGAIGRLVRAKFVSGNSIPVTRITLERSEVFGVKE